MLMEGSVAMQIVYGRSRGCTKSCPKLMEGTADARNIDGSQRKGVRVQRKLTYCLQLHGKLMELPADAWKVDESWQIDPRPHRKLTEGDGRSHSHTEC